VSDLTTPALLEGAMRTVPQRKEFATQEIARLKAEVEDRDYRIKTLDACYQRALRDVVKSSRDLALLNDKLSATVEAEIQANAELADAKQELALLKGEVERLEGELESLSIMFHDEQLVRVSLQREYDQYKEMVGEALQKEVERLDAALGAERRKVEKQCELIDFYDAKVAAIFKWRESAFIPNDSDEKELNRILTGGGMR